MTLSEYRATYGVSYSHIARTCGCSQAAISQIASGTLTPSFDLAVRVEAATFGHVERDNWFPAKAAPVSITIGATL